MTYEEVHKVLNRLTEIHANLRTKVDFQTENKARAIWYLQGAAISAGYSQWSMYENGLAVSSSQGWRYLNEIRDLVKLFENIEDRDRRIKAWYKGHVVERRRNEKLPPVTGMPDGFYEEENELRKKLSDDLSKFVHPTIKVARYNVYKIPFNNESFNYDWSNLKQFNEILIVVQTALIVSIHTLLTPVNSFPLSIQERDELNTLYEVVRSWSHN